MKKQIILLSMIFGSLMISAQSDDDATGMPGDNFNLHGALELFKNSSNPEEFEKALNTESNQVNNLDLNEDGKIDYVRVVSQKEGDIHILILQVPVSANESQDVAVIEIEKNGKENALLQIIGDEDIFGEEVIIEPSDGNDDEEDEDDGGRGPNASKADNFRVVVNVWGWPVIRYVYAPAYRPWVSPWRWGSYPLWWSPWRPLAWNTWRPLRVRYYTPTVRVVRTHRVVNAHRVYKPVRVTSTTVRTRHATTKANYKVNRTKTTVKGPRGNSVSKTSTKVKGPKGNVKAQKTTVKRNRRG